VEQSPTSRSAAHASIEHTNLVAAHRPARQGPASPVLLPTVAGTDCRTCGPHLSPVVDRAQSYIWGHLAEPLPLAKIACIARCSRRHLCARFLLETGDTVGGYIRRVRLLCAASEVRSGVKITAVAPASAIAPTATSSVSFERRSARTHERSVRPHARSWIDGGTRFLFRE
jgi:transcriptional regulator GlxA family with amidase domain